MRAPWFWRETSIWARIVAAALTPFSWLYDLGRRARIAFAKTEPVGKPGIGPVIRPVICIGNATVGGAGKTPTALLVQELLAEAGLSSCFQTRGFAGRLTGPTVISTIEHNAEDAGDEALLLARVAPTVVAKSRAAGVRFAAGRGDVVIMDDGYQNPTVAKTLSILLVDREDPFGNGRMLPAGPLREPIAAARDRADIILYTGVSPVSTSLHRDGDVGKYVSDIWLAPVDPPTAQTVIAFCGLGRPEKFFQSLRALGFDIKSEFAFPDHHLFSNVEIEDLKRRAKKANAALITTEKDYIRIPIDMRDDILTLPVRMEAFDRDGLRAAILSGIGEGERL